MSRGNYHLTIATAPEALTEDVMSRHRPAWKSQRNNI